MDTEAVHQRKDRTFIKLLIMTPVETFLTENKQPITIFITARDKDLPHICLIALKSPHLIVHNECNSVIEAHC